MSHENAPVLVVDDDEDVRDSLRDVLELEHYLVVTAGNGKEALDRLRDMEPPCLILLDLMMPVMSGEELMAEMKGSDDLRSIPVVVVSASREAKMMKDRVQGLVAKPIPLRSLLAIVAQFCSRCAS